MDTRTPVETYSGAMTGCALIVHAGAEWSSAKLANVFQVLALALPQVPMILFFVHTHPFALPASKPAWKSSIARCFWAELANPIESPYSSHAFSHSGLDCGRVRGRQ